MKTIKIELSIFKSKLFLIIIFLLIYTSLSARTYYVAVTGKDNDPGTLQAPWSTWQKAFKTADAGDTVYFRGGTYPTTVINGRGITYNPGGSIGHDGTSENWICYFNYPNEIPILDCAASKRNNSGGDNVYNYGIKLTGVDYVHMKGLHIINVEQTRDNVTDLCIGLNSYHSNHLKLENMVITNVDGQAFQNMEAYYLEVLNCDSYDHSDTYGATPDQTGGWGTGFQGGSQEFENGYEFYYGCRAWNCSDQGFSSANSRGTVIFDRCWSFNNGASNGDGHGWKIGYWDYVTSTPLVITITNCIAAFNFRDGWSGNEHSNSYTVPMHVFNNISYHNGRSGFIFYNTSSIDADELKRTLKNNIAYKNTNNFSLGSNALATNQYNSWNTPPGITVSDADFLDLPADNAKCLTVLGAARKSDGSLPDRGNYFNLSAGSDLIDAGIDVGLHFNGSSPDIGEFETVSDGSAVVPEYLSSIIKDSSPFLIEMEYNLALSNIIPAPSAFIVRVNSVIRTINSVTIAGTKVQLTLESAIGYSDIVTITYTKPVSNPLQTTSGGQAASIIAQTVTNSIAAPVPVYLSSAIENATPTSLELKYSLTLANIVPAASAFIVTVNSVARSVSSAAVSGTKVLLSLSSPIVFSDVVAVSYTKPSLNPLQISSGGQAASVSAQIVTNRVAAPVPVYLSSAIENATPSRLELTYSLTLTNIVPAASAFIVTVNSVARSVSSVAVSGTKVLLSFSSPLTYGNVVTVAYTKPSLNPLQTSSGGQAETFSTKSVTNNLSACINETFTSVSGTVTDNSGSSNYFNNMSCDKLIQPSGGGTITLTFTSFNIEANYDFVRVYAGSTTSAPLLGTFTGTSLPTVLTSTAGSMLIRFTTDVSVVAAGWSATYISNVSGGCINETFTSVSGTVTDNSGSSNYFNNMSCDKLIQPAGGGTITLTFTSFNIEANYDFVRVYAGSTTSAPLLGTFTGTSLPAVLTSTAGSMLIRFTTDVSVVAAGWSATYISNVSGGCINETFTSVSGTVTDNSGSSNYFNNMSCDKLIQPAGGGTITLTFTSFNIEANYDFVRVYAGSTTSAPLLGTFTGTSLPAVLTSTAGSMLIRFTTDVSVVAAGWSATYITRKSGGVNGTEDNTEQEILTKFNLVPNPNPTSEIPVADLIAYPNPTSGIITIKSTNIDKETYTIHVINLSGLIILNQRMDVIGGKFEIDLSDLNSGLYLLRIMTNKTDQLLRIIKK